MPRPRLAFASPCAPRGSRRGSTRANCAAAADWAPASYYSPEAKLAGLALALGDPDQAIAERQRALAPRTDSPVVFKNGFFNFPLTRAVLQLNPVLDPLRGDERFKQLFANAPAGASARAAAQQSVAVLAFYNRNGE